LALSPLVLNRTAPGAPPSAADPGFAGVWASFARRAGRGAVQHLLSLLDP
jgi:hypothetical protein